MFLVGILWIFMAAKAASGEQIFLNKLNEFVTTDEMESTISTVRNYLPAV